ncbi:DUF2062 domain-containing protein [[Limnothrix rosea] IAM M-220]|uniref:DUF2062 domain-containing protein n=1 Tax=[Limnothrix rosea] IAM M-220 TaxID=454133 RepID=UPI001CECA882|nr:DUF2062 domain-containing protein [[Limnothrix rosea] IAM M-220]
MTDSSMVVSQPLSRKRVRHPFLRWVKYWYLKIRRQEGTSEAIARGWACGVFAGCFPLFGLQTLLGLFLATIIRGNKFTAAAGTWISNPFTYVPIYYFNFRVGEVVLQQRSDFSVAQLESWAEMGVAGVSFITTLFAGCTVVGMTLGISAYFGTFALTNYWRSRQKQHQNVQNNSH